MPPFSLHRFWAVVLKEFIQMMRDRVTFGMMVGIPLMQLLLFGFAINSDPKHLPTALRAADQGPVRPQFRRRAPHQRLLRARAGAGHRCRGPAPPPTRRGAVRRQHPGGFLPPAPARRASHRADRGRCHRSGGHRPAVAAARTLAATVFDRDLRGPLARLRGQDGPVVFAVHAQYNPENITQYNIVPGLMGVVLTMTMVMITALAITRERERGTMENLLATPVRPIEVMLGKILPYIAVGYIQVTLILLAARFIFQVPMLGSVPLLYAVALLFIAANLAVGITFSTLAKNQLQAVQMAFFFFLPSILLSGFMFPFRGMPEWAQWLGSVLPNTHFLRIVRGILLKGNGPLEIAPELWPLLLFLVVAMAIGVKRYRQTLD
jgi:ABC-2 type transport system permease protein